MDLALDNLQRLICHKTQQTDQPICTKPLVTVPRALITIGLPITFMLYSFYYHFYYYFNPWEIFLHQLTQMVFLWSLRDSKSSQLSRNLLSILADINNAVVMMTSTRSLISNTTSPYTNTTKSTNYNWYHRHFHVPQFFQFLDKIQVLIFLFGSIFLCSLPG